MDTRFLESLVLVCDRGSIAEAARQQNLSPAALSERIRALEAEIGQALIRRVGRTVRPTEAGTAIAESARALLAGIRDLGAAGVPGAEVRGTLRLGAMSTATTGLLPAILKRLAAQTPGVEAHIAPGTSAELYQRVLGGELDAALVVEPPFALPKTCEARPMRSEKLILLAPARDKAADPFELLSSRPFIRYDRRSWGGMLVTRWLERAGIDPRERYELDALEAIGAFVHEGLGVAIVPDWAPPWPQGLELARLALPAHGIVRRIGLVWGRASPRLRLIDALLAASEPSDPGKPDV